MPEDFSSAGVLVEEKPDFSGSGTLIEEPSKVQATIPPWMQPAKPSTRSSLSGVTTADLPAQPVEELVPIPQLRATNPQGKPTLAQIEAGAGEVLKENPLQKIKSDYGLASMPDDQFLREHPELKLQYGLVTDMPMARVNAGELAQTTGLGKNTAGVIAGAQNAVADLADFMTSAPGIMTVLTGGVAGAAGRAGAVGLESAIHRTTAQAFAADMARNYPDQVLGIMDSLAKKDTAGATRQILNVAVALGVIGGATRATMAPKLPVDTRVPVPTGEFAQGPLATGAVLETPKGAVPQTSTEIPITQPTEGGGQVAVADELAAAQKGPNAIQKRSAETPVMGETPGSGAEVGARVPGTEKPAEAQPEVVQGGAPKGVQPKEGALTKQQRLDSKEFDDLVKNPGAHPDYGWYNAEMGDVHIGANPNQGIASRLHSEYLNQARTKAMSELGTGGNPLNMADRAAALPALKARIASIEKLTPVPLTEIPDGSEFTVHGEKFTVINTNPDTGIVTLKDGRTIRVDENSTVKIDSGSLKAKPQGDFVPEPPKTAPTLRPGEKGTGDLLQGQDAPFNLMGEKGTDAERIAAEKAKAEQAAAAKAQAEKKHPTLPGTEAPAQPGNKGLAKNVRNKWTQATSDEPFGSETGAISLGPLQDLVDRAAPHVKAVVDFIMATAKDIGKAQKMDDYRTAVLNWSGKIQRSFGEAAAAQKEIRQKIPNKVRRAGVTNWIQAAGDPAMLAARRAATAAWRDPVTGKPHPKQKELLAGYDAALTLTPDEIAVASDVKNAYDTLHSRGVAHDILNAFKDNYVTQIWDLKRSPTGATGGGGGSKMLKDKFRFSKASTFDTFFDGEQAGFVPKTKDISQLLPVYLHEMNSVIAARQMVAQMSKGKASDGRPLIAAKGVGVPVDGPSGKATLIMPDVPKGADTKDYKTLENQPALHGWRWATKDTAGKPIFLKGDLALHPEAYSRLKNVLGKSAIREWYNTKTSNTAQIPKLLVKGLDMANSETKRTMLGLLAPFHQFQEGTHAVGHRVNPFFNVPKIDLVKDAGQMDAARHGLMLLPDQVSESQFMEGFRPSGLVSKIPGVGAVADFYSNYLFHEYIPGLKYKTYSAILERNQKVYAKDIASGKVSLQDVKHLSATQTNAAFGHLNYADLATNPTIQHLKQLALLAPDFLEARARFLGQSITGLTGAKVGREQLVALGALALGQAALAYIGAKTTGGEWDKKRPFEFHRGNRTYTIRSVPEDALRLATDWRPFVYSRLAPITGRGTVQYISGVDWRGRKVTPGQTTKELLMQPLPLTARALLGVGNTPLSGLEQLAGAAGIKISRYSENNNVQQMARDWAKGSDNPKVASEAIKREQQVFGDSIYKGIRDSLAKRDPAAVSQEIKAVVAAESDAAHKSKRLKEIVSEFNPYTYDRSGNVSGTKPFATHSKEYEPQFLKSLDAEGKRKYDAALKERVEDFKMVQRALSGALGAVTNKSPNPKPAAIPFTPSPSFNPYKY